MLTFLLFPMNYVLKCFDDMFTDFAEKRIGYTFRCKIVLCGGSKINCLL